MPLYISDYLSATSHLDAAQSGAYLHLIIHYWQKGCLPDDDKFLARIARMTDRQWASAKPTILPLFVKDRFGEVPALRSLGEYEPTFRPAIPEGIKAEVIARDGGSCVYCGSVDGPIHF